MASLQAAGYEVVGISPDPVDKLARFAAAEGLNFPLLSDADHAVAEAYAAWGEKKNYGKTYRASSAPPSSSTLRARSQSRSTTSGPPGMSPSCAGT